MLKLEKVKMLIFDTPPLQNQCFWVPMEVTWRLKSIFIAIENDDGKVMLYRGRSRKNLGQDEILGSSRGGI